MSSPASVEVVPTEPKQNVARVSVPLNDYIKQLLANTNNVDNSIKLDVSRMLLSTDEISAKDIEKIKELRGNYLNGLVDIKGKEINVKRNAIIESARKEKNAYADNSLRRTFGMQPTRLDQVMNRLKDGDISFIKDTNNGPWENLKQSASKLRDLKDKLFKGRLDRVTQEIRGLNIFDKFSRLQQEDIEKAQRKKEMMQYIDSELYSSGYKNADDVFIPQMFEANANDMKNLYKYRNTEFRKGLARKTATSSIMILNFFQTIFSLASIVLFRKATQKNEFKSTELYMIGIIGVIALLVQIYFSTSYAKRRHFSMTSCTTGMIASISMATIVTHTLGRDVEITDSEKYLGARNASIASHVFLAFTMFAFARATVAQSPPGALVGQEKDAKRIQSFDLFLFGVCCAVTGLFFIVPNLQEPHGRCKRMNELVCARKLDTAATRDLIIDKAWSNPGRIRDCSETLSSDFLVNSLNY